MEINSKKKHLFHIKLSFIMFLFAMCLTINAFFCSTYNFYESVDKTAATETWTVSENVVSDGDGDTCPILIAEVIPKRISLLLFLIVIFLFDFTILLPDKWTLIKQKVRLDN